MWQSCMVRLELVLLIQWKYRVELLLLLEIPLFVGEEASGKLILTVSESSVV